MRNQAKVYFFNVCPGKIFLVIRIISMHRISFWRFNIELLAVVCLMLFVLLYSTKKSRFNICNFSLLLADAQNLWTCMGIFISNVISSSTNGLEDNFRFFIFFKRLADITTMHYIHLIKHVFNWLDDDDDDDDDDEMVLWYGWHKNGI